MNPSATGNYYLAAIFANLLHVDNDLCTAYLLLVSFFFNYFTFVLFVYRMLANKLKQKI
uniref:Uncharacterized protein n=1 Tax=Lepeophtheirus salmonis TaxID=72036 RepID=A0A0K2SV82_LEPSM